jgi:hypothetical protein
MTFAVLAALASVANAEDEDPDHVPFQRTSIGVGVQGHGSRIGGQSEGGFGPNLELAVGRGRWQYLAEGAFASSNLSDGSTPAPQMDIAGRMFRGGVGLRWLARQFMFDRSGGVELLLSSLLGVQRLSFDDGGRLVRPELALGVGIQGRGFRRPRLAVRLESRVVFTPNAREGTLVACRVSCANEAGSSTGFMTGIAFAW